MLDTSTYGMYSLYDLQKKSPTQRGGENRAKYAIRDEHGRFMPADEVAFEEWKLDPEHGKKGGTVRAAKGQRVRGRFVKDGGHERAM